MSKQTKPLDTWFGQTRGSALGSFLVMVIIRISGVLPAYGVLCLISSYYTLFDHRSRQACMALRKRLFLSAHWYSAWTNIFCFGQNLIDKYAFLVKKKSPFSISCINEQFISVALSEGHGVMLLSAHVGNWEIAGNLLSDRLDATVNFLVLENENQSIKKLFKKAELARRVNIIEVTPGKPDAMIRIISALRNNEIVAIHGDRCIGAESARPINFLGAQALFPCGPFLLAAAAQSPIIPIFVVKQRWDHYLFTAHDPIRISAARGAMRDEQVAEAMVGFVKVLETVVRKHPNQWFNFFDFWGQPKR